MNANQRTKRLNRQTGLSLLLATLLVAGCSSTRNLESDRPVPYGGVVSCGESATMGTAYALAAGPQGGVAVLAYSPLIAFDLACSAVVDTLMLPWALYRMIQPGPALFPPNTLPRISY